MLRNNGKHVVQEMKKLLYRCLLEHSVMLKCRPHCLAYRGTCFFKQDIRVDADNSELGISDMMGAMIQDLR
jgi:hypothetical protein